MRRTKPLCLHVCPRIVGCSEVVFGAHYPVYEVEELGEELLSVPREDV